MSRVVPAVNDVRLLNEEHEDVAVLREAEAIARRLLFFYGVRGAVACARSDYEWEDAIREFARKHGRLEEAEDKLDAALDRLEGGNVAFNNALSAVADAAQLLGLATGWRLAQGGADARSLADTFFGQDGGVK